MLGEMFYLFRKYGDAIAQSYNSGFGIGMLLLETNMSGRFVNYYTDVEISIFMFNNVKKAIELFRKEIERLRDDS